MGNPDPVSGHDGSILSAWVVNQNAGLASYCQLVDSAILKYRICHCRGPDILFRRNTLIFFLNSGLYKLSLKTRHS